VRTALSPTLACHGRIALAKVFFVELCTNGIKRDPIFAMPLEANARTACDDFLPREVAPSDLNLRDYVRRLHLSGRLQVAAISD
jgi:hypothetical protein